MDRRGFIKGLGVAAGVLALPRVAWAEDLPKITIEVPEATARHWELQGASPGLHEVYRYYLGEHEQRDALEKTLGSNTELGRFRERLARQRVLRTEVTVMLPHKGQTADISYVREFQLCQYEPRHGCTCHIFWDAMVREYEDRIVIQGDTMTPEELERAFEFERRKLR